MLPIVFLLFTSRVNCDESFGGPKFPRNASLSDPFPAVVENFQRLARITNGFSLEIGLIDGSIPTDSALAELLHMTPLKPDDVINIKSEVLNAAIKITNLPTNLDSSNDLKGFEDRLVVLEKMTEFAGEIGDFSTIPYLLSIQKYCTRETQKFKKMRGGASPPIFAKPTHSFHAQ
ncbi:hypothetical protein B9Z55_008462 [Caenorhabditis nigoni]|uniref:Domain of unknown function WSN domain-containing protein n=1 Tax=Caenorhabditis nigoni TaxID=1611254 RepID=A0A2G5UMP6_9PELO|nr:hypothetical protein B9Z55_008462 [Caenorhabditis nigoni]